MKERYPIARDVPRSGLYRLVGSVAASPAFGFMGGLSQSGEANLPNRARPYILAATHRSFLDVPALGLAFLRTADRDIHFMAMKRLFKRPAAAHFLAACGAYPVDRDDRGPKMKAPLYHANKIMASGGVTGIFPEGGQKPGQIVNRNNLFKGVAWLAVKARAAIVPVGIAGTDKGEVGPVHVTFGEPVDPGELASALPYLTNRRDFLSAVMDEVHYGMQSALDDTHTQRTETATQIINHLPTVTMP